MAVGFGWYNLSSWWFQTKHKPTESALAIVDMMLYSLVIMNILLLVLIAVVGIPVACMLSLLLLGLVAGAVSTMFEFIKEVIK